ncbi:hypothetical protein [Opitutus sp. ER46]|uniref:hypothetical protein n=1 Tax=Opitutus sp. ER46 TaxID=2161864 RepID=UPI001E512221|nr:hypothetical protein [Opitutus sp. ER46]
MRVERPVKALRQAPTDAGETDEKKAAGANGTGSRMRRRPGRAASLRSSSNRTRSQRWRVPKKGARRMRRGNAVRKGAK